MIYLDANVLIYAAANEKELGEKARRILKAALQDKNACTSTLTIDEVLWTLKKKLGRQEAAVATRNLLDTGIELVAVERTDIERALLFFEGSLDPRDAIHAAVAIRRGCETVVSTDPAFASIAGLKHKTI